VVNVTGPNGYTAQCAAQVSGDPAVAGDESWSCQVVLWDSALAFGEYEFSAQGQTSGVTEFGAFTDSPKVAAVSVTPETRSVFAGGSAAYQVTVTRGAPGSPGQDDFSACLYIDFMGGTPAGVSASFAPGELNFAASTPTQGSQLSVSTTAGTTPAGSYPFTVTAARKTGNVNDPCPPTLPSNFNDTASDSGMLVVYTPLTVTKTANPSLTRT
jgi:hypothetical protein